MQIHHLTLPLDASIRKTLSRGDKVLFSGTLYTARDRTHQLLIDLLTQGQQLPLDFSAAALFYCGPSPTPPGRICGAIGPTTSARMDPFTPALLQAGLRVMIGKGPRSVEVERAIREYEALYLVCVGGISALLSQTVVSCETYLWPELGSEAVHKLVVRNLPCYVSIV